jgi:hypothetical protein
MASMASHHNEAGFKREREGERGREQVKQGEYRAKVRE